MASSARIAALLRGTPEYDYQLWRSNISGEEIELIGTVERGVVSMSNFRDHTWSLGLQMRADQSLDLFSDYVKVIVRVRDREEWLRFPMGLYRFESGSRGSSSPLATSWDLVGRSPEALLLDDLADNGYMVPAGTGILTAVEQILAARGVPGGRVKLPYPDTPLSRDLFFSPYQDASSCYWLRIVNAILSAGGYYAIYTDNEGIFTTKQIEASGAREPGVIYGANASRADAEQMIVGEIGFDHADESFANKVTIYAGDAGEDANTPPTVSTAELHSTVVSQPNDHTVIVVDPDSSVSYEALGNRWIRREPEAVSAVNSQEAANLMSVALLRRVASRSLKLTLPTLPDPRRAPREDYELAVYQDDGTLLYDGSWRVTNWELPLDLSEMTHELSAPISGNSLYEPPV